MPERQTLQGGRPHYAVDRPIEVKRKLYLVENRATQLDGLVG